MRVIMLAVFLASLGSVGTGWAQPVDDDSDDDDSAAALWYGEAQAAEGQPAAGPEAAAEPVQEWRYNGPHPINAAYGSGWCDIAEPHTHPYPPFDEYLFEEEDGGYYFLGDPVDFGYVGAYYWFEDPHPIASGWGHGWCHMSGPHRHVYGPFGTGFAACGRHYCYRGPFDALYWRNHGLLSAYFRSHYGPHYRGGLYYRNRVPAYPGRFAGYRPGHRPGTPAGRPGGYGRPVFPRPATPFVRPSPPRGPAGLAPGHAPARPLPGRWTPPPRRGFAPAPAPRVMSRAPSLPAPRHAVTAPQGHRPSFTAPPARSFRPSAPATRSFHPSAPAHASRPSHASPAPRSGGNGRHR